MYIIRVEGFITDFSLDCKTFVVVFNVAWQNLFFPPQVYEYKRKEFFTKVAKIIQTLVATYAPSEKLREKMYSLKELKRYFYKRIISPHTYKLAHNVIKSLWRTKQNENAGPRKRRKTKIIKKNKSITRAYSPSGLLDCLALPVCIYIRCIRVPRGHFFAHLSNLKLSPQGPVSGQFSACADKEKELNAIAVNERVEGERERVNEQPFIL